MLIDGLSVVIPVFNEQDNVQTLIEEVKQALDESLPYEILFVDDASLDGTATNILLLTRNFSNLRLIRHRRNLGQSAAVVTGVRHAKYAWVATLDGDGQNDPKDLVILLNAIKAQSSLEVLCIGQRQQRRDTWLRKFSSRIANQVRQSILKDACPDSACGIKIFPRNLFLTLPLFKNCHRFMPALFTRAGATVIQVPVTHRERRTGISKYGVHNRLWVGIVDLFGVSWLMRRFIECEKQDV